MSSPDPSPRSEPLVAHVFAADADPRRVAEIVLGRADEQQLIFVAGSSGEAARVLAAQLGAAWIDGAGPLPSPRPHRAVLGAAGLRVLFEAQEIAVWTGVGGVLSADPREVPEAVLLPHLSYAEASELSYFGAKIVDPLLMSGVVARKIPIAIRALATGRVGTRITATSDPAQPIKGVTTSSGLALVNLEGAGMLGVPGTAERVFGALREAGISVVMISQGSSEHSICCVVEAAQAARAQAGVLAAFASERAAGEALSVETTGGISTLAIVGDGMAGTPGVAARLFTALARAGINVRAIAQGVSERSISVAVATVDAARALRAVHTGFYLSPQTLSIGVIGPGNVGGAFLDQVEAMRDKLSSERGLDLRVRAVAASRAMLLVDGATSQRVHGAGEALRAGGAGTQATDLSAFADHVQAAHLPHAVIIDCSASDEVSERYAGWLARGIHVVTANKHAGSGPWPRYAAIHAATTRARFRYESTVGAGLPIIGTLRDLLDTGDEIIAVEGIFSGTLAYIFNSFDGAQPFSALVRSARERGYTEPDPRDDLSGRDVARKLVILAREAGGTLSLDAVALESLVPPALREVEAQAFLDRLGELDGPMQARLERARAAGTVLRYVARLEAGGAARVGLVELPATHAFSHTRLTDNVVQLTTKRYRDNPLVVQGPGAGRDVTAAGVFADLLRIAASLGARL